MKKDNIGSSFDDLTKETGQARDIIISAHIKTGLKTKLQEIIKECSFVSYRILIEVEPSGKMYFWCDRINKRNILGMVRRQKIKQNLNWQLTDENTKYLNYDQLVYLERDKGKILMSF